MTGLCVSMQVFKSCANAVHWAAPSPLAAQQFNRDDIKRKQGLLTFACDAFLNFNRGNFGNAIGCATFLYGIVGVVDLYDDGLVDSRKI